MEVLEKLIRNIEENSIDNTATISNVKLWAKRWREEQIEAKNTCDEIFDRAAEVESEQLKCQCAKTEKYYDPIGGIERCQECERAL